MSCEELEYYRGQLIETKKLNDADPLNKDLIEIIKQLEAKLTNLESMGTVKPDVLDLEIGRTCEVFYDNKWFNAEVHSYSMTENSETRVIVRLLGTDQGREYDLRDIKLLPRADPAEYPTGTHVQAIWRDDGLWYPATVNSTTDEGDFMIIFDGFDGEPQKVKPDQIRRPIMIKVNESKRTKGEEKTYVTPAGYVIPEKLKIDRTRDTEAVIESKKRKIHMIKTQQRNEKHTAEAMESRSKWQSFQQKLGKR